MGRRRPIGQAEALRALAANGELVLGHALGVPGLRSQACAQGVESIGICEGEEPVLVEQHWRKLHYECGRGLGVQRLTGAGLPAKPLCAECSVQDDCTITAPSSRRACGRPKITRKKASKARSGATRSKRTQSYLVIL